MRIESARLHRIQIPFRGSFGHALSARSRSDAVLVELRDDRAVVGWGEILPRSYVTGETIDGVLGRGAPAIVERLWNHRFSDRAEVEAWIHQVRPTVGRDLASFGGIEIALLDVAGRRLKFSLAQVMGGPVGEELRPGVVIGFEIETEALHKHCIGLRWKGHTHIKVKVGRSDDALRLAAITRVFGPEVPLRLDANATWSASEAIERLRALGDIPIASIEQPVAADDLAGMRAVREQTGLAVMADESVCSGDDARAVIDARAADIFNIRVGKHGGVLASQQIAEDARTAGLSIHLGTLVGESGILSRVAEVFGRCVPGFACLDGKGQNRFLLAEDILRRPSDDPSNPATSARLDAFGLGVEVDPDAIDRLRIGDPIELHAPVD